MAEEAARVIKRKRIKLPSGGTVDIPVITEISFVDPVDRSQETRHTVDNTSAADRDTHTAVIPGDGQATIEDGSGGNDGLKVERLDLWRLLDSVERGQETFVTFDSKTIAQPPEAPPYFTTHLKTHIVKYINTPADDNSLKSELIDEFSIVDPVHRGQETHYTLSNPPDNDSIDGLTLGTDSDGTPTVAIDPSIDEITDGNGDPDPVRTDPFQNIVDFGGLQWIVMGLNFVSGDTGNTNPGGSFPLQAVGSQVYSFSYFKGFQMFRGSPRPETGGSGTLIIGGKTLSYSGLPNPDASDSFTAWTVCGFDTPSVPFSGSANAVKATASGSPYLHYPNDTHPEPGWVDALSVTLDCLMWNGTGPFLVYGTDPSATAPGMLTSATAAQFKADWVDVFPSQPNRSIFEYGDIQGTMTADFSGLEITEGSIATWLPVAVFLPGITLRDGYHEDNASGGQVNVLLKRQ